MKKILKWTVIAVAALLVIGMLTSLGGGDKEAAKAVPTTTTQTVAPKPKAEKRTKVDWEHMAPVVKERIDSLDKKNNCEGLEEQFQNAEANDARMRHNWGSGNADLMQYILEAQKESGCLN